MTTANTLQTIPRPLLDRMEVISVSSYTENEKMHIAKEHLMKKQLERHGLEGGLLSISDGALWKIIRNYTKEAGVRTLSEPLGSFAERRPRRFWSRESGYVSRNGIWDSILERKIPLSYGKQPG